MSADAPPNKLPDYYAFCSELPKLKSPTPPSLGAGASSFLALPKSDPGSALFVDPKIFPAAGAFPNRLVALLSPNRPEDSGFVSCAPPKIEFVAVVEPNRELPFVGLLLPNKDPPDG